MCIRTNRVHRVIFVELMAEMRRPMDFWKSMALAQLFITFAYMFFGLFVYSYQGQFVVNVRSCTRWTNTQTDTFY